MLTFTVEELIRFLSNWTMTFFEGAKRSGDIVLSVPRERFLDIASKLDSLAFDDDPYEYHDNEGVESISDIADNLLNPTYRKAIIKALQDKQEYYAEDEFDDANIAERAKDILDNLAEIFGSDEQED